MHRKPLLDLLDRYLLRTPGEAMMVGRVRGLVTSRHDCFERTCQPGHVTASCWILSHDRSHFLLTHHRKLRRWLQLGGHADGDGSVLQVALREAREESGMRDFSLIDPGGAQREDLASCLPIDIDVHGIPARPGEPAHEHHDVRFVLVAGAEQPLVISDESSGLAWFPLDELASLDADESLLRLARKAIELRHAPTRALPADPPTTAG
jgi:8-oxo-dGTP pyrophosphatase MutT (NUDIX family)